MILTTYAGSDGSTYCYSLVHAAGQRALLYIQALDDGRWRWFFIDMSGRAHVAEATTSTMGRARRNGTRKLAWVYGWKP